MENETLSQKEMAISLLNTIVKKYEKIPDLQFSMYNFAKFMVRFSIKIWNACEEEAIRRTIEDGEKIPSIKCESCGRDIT